MKNVTAWIAMVAIAGAGVFVAIAEEYDHEARFRQVQAIIDRLKSEKMAEAEAALSELLYSDAVAQQSAVGALDEAANEYLDSKAEHRDGELIPPRLLIAISAVGGLRVYDADDTLLSILGVVDNTPMRAGGIGGGMRFPAAAALVEIRVDVQKVLSALQSAVANNREVRLLAWVVAKRLDSLEATKIVLKAKRQTPGVVRALEVVESAKEIGDLLPGVEQE